MAKPYSITKRDFVIIVTVGFAFWLFVLVGREAFGVLQPYNGLSKTLVSILGNPSSWIVLIACILWSGAIRFALHQRRASGLLDLATLGILATIPAIALTLARAGTDSPSLAVPSGIAVGGGILAVFVMSMLVNRSHDQVRKQLKT